MHAFEVTKFAIANVTSTVNGTLSVCRFFLFLRSFIYLFFNLSTLKQCPRIPHPRVLSEAAQNKTTAANPTKEKVLKKTPIETKSENENAHQHPDETNEEVPVQANPELAGQGAGAPNVAEEIELAPESSDHDNGVPPLDDSHKSTTNGAGSEPDADANKTPVDPKSPPPGPTRQTEASPQELTVMMNMIQHMQGALTTSLAQTNALTQAIHNIQAQATQQAQARQNITEQLAQQKGSMQSLLTRLNTQDAVEQSGKQTVPGVPDKALVNDGICPAHLAGGCEDTGTTARTALVGRATAQRARGRG